MELTLLFLPFIASIISGFFGRYIGDRASEIITSFLVSVSAIISLVIFYNVIVKIPNKIGKEENCYNWKTIIAYK